MNESAAGLGNTMRLLMSGSASFHKQEVYALSVVAPATAFRMGLQVSAAGRSCDSAKQLRDSARDDSHCGEKELRWPPLQRPLAAARRKVIQGQTSGRLRSRSDQQGKADLSKQADWANDEATECGQRVKSDRLRVLQRSGCAQRIFIRIVYMRRG